MTNLVPIPTFQSYFADRDGNIYSGKRGKVQRRKLILDRRGYYALKMRRDGKTLNAMVHRLVLETFVGPCPIGQEARHLNAIKTDNRLENLVWGTRSDNEKDKIPLRLDNRGSRNGMSKLNEESVRCIRSDHAKWGFSHAALGRMYNVSRTTISVILEGKAWQHA
jgi:hypothetical protein